MNAPEPVAATLLRARVCAYFQKPTALDELSREDIARKFDVRAKVVDDYLAPAVAAEHRVWRIE